MEKGFTLSSKELLILSLVTQGLTSEAIGIELKIVSSTVQIHRLNMLRKSKFNNTQQLVGWAIRERLVT